MDAGLENVLAAETVLSDVDGAAGRLVLRGYELDELAGRATFEEVIHLLWSGFFDDLPTASDLPAALGAAEWLRGNALTGFPWLLPAYVWTPGEAVSQFAAVGGVYLLSVLSLFWAAAPALLADVRRHRRALAAATFTLAAVWTWGALRLASAQEAPPGPIVRVADAAPLAIAAWRVGLAALVVVPLALAFGKRRGVSLHAERAALAAGPVARPPRRVVPVRLTAARRSRPGRRAGRPRRSQPRARGRRWRLA